MKAPQAIIKSHCDELEYFQRKLCLKDNGTNTEEVLFLLRYLEKTQSDMKATKDFGAAFTFFYLLWQDLKIAPLMEKYGLTRL